MKTVMVRYRVKADRVDDNVRQIDAVFAELARTRPGGLAYASFKLDDGVSFVHLAAIDTADGANPLTELESFAAFTSAIRERCEEPPVTSLLEAVGVYRLFGATPDAPQSSVGDPTARGPAPRGRSPR